MKKLAIEPKGDAPAERPGASKASANVANACTNCQKRRTKCDGKNPCIKCATRSGSVCNYEISLKASKAEMKRENTQLRQQLASSAQILSALGSGHEVPSILQGLRDHEHLASIAQRITPSSSPQVKRSPSTDSCDTAFSYVSSDVKRENDSLKFGSLYESPLTKTSPTTQGSDFSTVDSPFEGPATVQSSTVLDATSQTLECNERPLLPRSIGELRDKACRGPTDLSDQRLIKHLFCVYWVWLHPHHLILDMEQFVKSYDSGSESYCSLYLVYAVCIAACEYLDPFWETVEGKYTDVARLRQNLVAEARVLESTIDLEHKAKTAMQAEAIMSFTYSKVQGIDGNTRVGK